MSHRAAWHGGVQVWRVVGTDAERVDEERALVLNHRAAEAEAVVDVLFGAPDRHERAAAAQAIVAHQQVREVAQRSDARLRDDLNRHPAGGVKLRRELIAGDADRSNHRLGRQRPALEAVDADDGAGPGHLLQLLLQHRRVVRQRVDLIARQRRPERRTIAV